MVKLYYAPGACSLASHIALAASESKYELVKVDLKTHKLEDGTDYYTINPKGSVPAIKLDDGLVLTEGPAILQYVADHNKNGLLAPTTDLARYKTVEVLSYVSDLHKAWAPLWGGDKSAEAALKKKYEFAEKHLEGKQYTTGSDFTIADAYLFTVTNWANFLKIDLSSFKNLQDFQERVSKLSSVQRALKEEGLAQ
eukprot:TRINITY_DN1066_c0_g1_i1.p1 TRINITY_DN1066_c0_g1~~TRINITY_DN1066_c0_g1_i1.p1  ORF type:complete len:196 (-),score=55.48 TRINITY_DN1066_c0_g1_i1:35-622(-)